MLTVAVCRTKRNDHGDMLTKAIAAGVAACGDDPIWIECRNDIQLLRTCCAAVMICERHPDKTDVEHVLRNQIVEALEQRRLPRLIIETGFIRNAKAERRKEQNIADTYWAAGWNGIKRAADYCVPDNCDASRWQALRLPAVPGKGGDPSGRVLVFGQVDDGYAEIGLDMPAEYRRVMAACRKHLPQTSVVFRPHPSIIQRSIPREYERKIAKMGFQIDPFHDMQLLLKGSRVAVTWASNAAVDAMLVGVPIVCLSELNPAWAVSEHDVDRIASPHVPHVSIRQAMANRLAWCQWSLQEFRDGTAWRILRTGAKRCSPQLAGA